MPKQEMTPEAQAAYDEALRRIKKCGPSGRNLSLSGLGLTALPPEIGELQRIRHLVLEGNQLTMLPPEIGQLTALTVLSLSNNQLTTLPPEIGRLRAMMKLFLQENQLSMLPPEIGQLTALTEVNLGNNQFTTLPAELTQLKALKEIWLGYNFLTTLPPEIGQLPALMVLSMRNNQLRTLPEEIGQLQSLVWLWLNDNQLTKLPEALRKLVKLEQLFLHGNPGLELPIQVLGPAWDDVRDKKVKPADPKAVLELYFSQHSSKPPLKTTVKLEPAATPLERLLGRTVADNDLYSRIDHLGRERHAVALTRFISHPQTGTPLTVSVEGLWGSGKTSFMRQVEGHLARSGQRPVTVWFNPWRHIDAAAMWAAFALEMARQLREQSDFGTRWYKGPLRLWLDCPKNSGSVSKWLRFWARLAFLVFIILAFLACVCGFAAAIWDWREHGGKSLLALWNTVQANVREGSVPANVWTLIKTAAGIEAVRWIWKLRETPLAGKIAKLLRAETRGEQPSDMERFHADFARMVRAYAGERRLFVFVDDLDRCEVPKAAELMQAINLMFSGEDMKAVFILGMDREKVAAGIAVKHKELLPYLYSRERRGKIRATEAGKETPDLEESLHGHGLEFGYDFIEKFIQLPFRLPAPADDGMRQYLHQLTGVKIGKVERERHAGGIEKKRAESPFSPELPPRDDKSAWDRAKTRMKIHWKTMGISFEPSDSETQKPTEAVEKALRQVRLAEEVTTDEGLHDALEMVLPFLGHNPRRLKQALNLLRLWSYLAAEWLHVDKPKLKLKGVRPEEPILTLKKLAKVIVMELRWPVKLLNLMDEASRPNVDVKVSISSLTNEFPKELLDAGGNAGRIRVCDLRAILSVATPASRRDSAMDEKVLVSEGQTAT